MNDKLRSSHYKNREAVLGDQIVRFDGNSACKGIVRYAGGAYLDEPNEINETTLREARKYPDLFNVDDVSTEVNEAHPRAKKVVKKAEPVPVESVPVEVEGKTVIDAPPFGVSVEEWIDKVADADGAKLVDTSSTQ